MSAVRVGDVPLAEKFGLPIGTTPLLPLRRLSAYLGGPEIWVKRDDVTGLAFGGNKLRKLDYLLRFVRDNGYDAIIGSGGYQSNFCTQLIAACRHADIEVALVKSGPVDDFTDEPFQGNDLLQRTMDAAITVVEGTTVAARVEALADELRSRGRNPFVMPDAGSDGIGCQGYVECAGELDHQCQQRGIRPAAVFLTSGSGGTQAGICVGAALCSLAPRVVTACTGSRPSAAQEEKVRALVADTCRALDVGGTTETAALDMVEVFDGYHGGGYGYIDDRKFDTIALLARTEGIFLDPVYTATSMACLIDRVRDGAFTRTDSIVFVHTGGGPGLFAYADLMMPAIAHDRLGARRPRWGAAH